jgi:hypothetical protein
MESKLTHQLSDIHIYINMSLLFNLHTPQNLLYSPQYSAYKYVLALVKGILKFFPTFIL